MNCNANRTANAGRIRSRRDYLEDHIQIVIFANDFLQFDHIRVADLLQSLNTAESSPTRIALGHPFLLSLL